MIGVIERAVLVVRELVRALHRTAAISVLQTCLHPVSARQPTEKVIEGTVFHHDDDHMLDAGCARIGQCGGDLDVAVTTEAPLATSAHSERAGRRGDPCQELATR